VDEFVSSVARRVVGKLIAYYVRVLRHLGSQVVRLASQVVRYVLAWLACLLFSDFVT